MTRITLQDMLNAREQRAELQNELLESYKTPLISCTMNIAGDVKDFLLSRQVFESGFDKLVSVISEAGMEILHKRYTHESTGSLGFISVSGDATEIKRKAVELEERLSFGRLFDFDVIATDKRKLTREELGISGRKCLLCDNDAFICSRSRAHSAEELFAKTLAIMKEATDALPIFNKIAEAAVNALMFEVSATPKPGLVDRANNGAHRDMDFFTFIRSANALYPYFSEFARSGYNFDKENKTELFDGIRGIGIQAEQAMFKATKGINTHKGLIFSMGNICAAYGYFAGKGQRPTAEDLCNAVGDMTKDVINKDLGHLNAETAASNGEKMFVRHRTTGIRGEASGGFQTVRKWGLPVFSKLYSEGADLNDACVQTLLSIMTHLEDTNILWRHDMAVLEYAREQASEVLACGGILTEQGRRGVLDMDKRFIEKNISPGGAADLLAVTVAIYLMENL